MFLLYFSYFIEKDIHVDDVCQMIEMDLYVTYVAECQ